MRRWAHYLNDPVCKPNCKPTRYTESDVTGQDRERKNTNQSALLATERHRPT